MTGSPFTPEQEARIRAIYAEERDAWKKALPALAVNYSDGSAIGAPPREPRWPFAALLALARMLLTRPRRRA